jgi:hypothetical protein
MEVIRQKFTEYWILLTKWFIDTSNRSLLLAYAAALTIKQIEMEQFGGQIISPQFGNYSESVMSYWLDNLKRNLVIIKIRLAEFNSSRIFSQSVDSTLLEKLKFVDEVIAKYERKDQISQVDIIPQKIKTRTKKTSKKLGFLPRSLGITIGKITRDLNPKSEAGFVKNLRFSRNRTRRSMRFLLLLIIIPFLVQSLSKQILVNPIVERVRGDNSKVVFLNSDMEKEALQKLVHFREELKFTSLLHSAPKLEPEKVAEEVKNRAREIAAEFRHKSADAISNIFADFLALVAFAFVIVFDRRDIIFVQAFLDDTIYGLSDSAKAFVIILFTDIFVGFHSPHGWEVLLEEIAEHLGLPADWSTINLFIATFPVILATIFKYWIFRYLSRLSPSALATMKEMDS